MRHTLRFLVVTACAAFLVLSPRPAAAAPVFELKDGDRVVFLGDTLIEREQYYGWVELALTARYPDRNITFRNLGWSADMPSGDSRFGLSLLQAGHEPADEAWKQLVKQIEDAKPTVVFMGYGMASSFAGEAGLPKFKEDYSRLLDTIEKISPGVRFVLLSTVQQEAWSDVDPAPHNQQLALYNKAISDLAAARKAPYVDLFNSVKRGTAYPTGPVTDNGIHLNSQGYTLAALRIEAVLFGQGDANRWVSSSGTEALRQAILKKNDWFFHRSRPANMAYIFGFRKREQGNNAVEIPKFDEYIAAEEKRIATLRSLKAGVNPPEVKTHVGNLTAKLTPQPHPSFEVGEGLEVTLWAENPLLHKPIQMNFDPQGRLWVASSEVYPQIEPGQEETDKIIVLEDTKGKGHADKATVFADGLLIPTGVIPGDGGCYVAQSTELLHFKDTNGDGKADKKTIVLSGFGTEDTHHNLHTLRWGPDGRLYVNQSVYTRTDTETPNGVVRLKAGGIFRLDPRDLRMEILFRGWVNAWGHHFDDFGQSLITDGAGFQGVSWGIPGATYFTLAPARKTLQSISPGNYPKFAGLEIIRSKQFPADWQGDVVTCDFRAHRVVRFKVSEQGAGYITKEMPDVLRTTADSFRPIDVKLGPDGAIYIADWSNPIIQHGEVDFRDPRRDKEHGRIWRITWKANKALPTRNLTKLKNSELLDAQLSPNSFDREQAKRVLVERGVDKVMKDLASWTKKQKTENGQLQALWMHDALNQPNYGLLWGVLAAKDGRIRAAAVRVLGNWTVEYPASLPDKGFGTAVSSPTGLQAQAAMLFAGLTPLKDRTQVVLAKLTQMVSDENPRVRVEAVRALGKLKSAAAAEAALTVLDKPMDPFIDHALWLTMNELAEPWVAAVQSGAWKFEGRENQLEFALKAIEAQKASEVLGQLIANRVLPRDGSGPWIELIGSAGGAKELRQLFDQLLKGEFVEPASIRAMTALAEASRLRGVKPTGELATFRPMLKANNEKVRIAALQLAGAWKLAAFSPAMIDSAADVKSSSGVRGAALSALREIGGAGIINDLKKLVGSAATPEIQRETVATVAALNLQSAMPEIIGTLKSTTQEADAQSLWRALLNIKGAGAKLATELPKAGLSKDAARAGLRVAREGNQNQPLVQSLMQIAGLTISDKELTTAELQAMAQEALAKGDAARGERIYRRQEMGCMTCHSIGGAGGKVGPDMTSIGASAPPDYLVESLLYPNRKIKEGFHSVVITTKDDQELSGIAVKETDNEIVIRNAANQEVSVAKKNIANRRNGLSLMPAGLVDTLLPEERLDLVKFLSQLGKPGEYDAAKGGAARLWRLYVITSPNQHIGVEPVVKGDFSLKDWKPTFSHVNGTLTKDEMEPAANWGRNTRGFFAATQFTAAKAGKISVAVEGGPMGAWLNGKPVKPGAQMMLDVPAGTSTFVLQIDENKLPDTFRMRCDDVSFLVN